MTTYRKKSDGSFVVGIEAFKALYPTTSFPKPITTEIINSYGFDEVYEGTQPSLNSPYEYSESDGVKEIDGKWTQTYKVSTQSDSAKAEIDSDTADSSRSQRNSLLEETDWTALSDVTMTDELKTYRQALRDLPKASGWPHTHTWPTKPS